MEKIPIDSHVLLNEPKNSASGQHEPMNILYSTRHDVSYIYGKNNEWKDNMGCPDPL